MIKILHIIWSARFGGIERLVIDLANDQSTNPEMIIGVLILQETGEFIEEFNKSNMQCYKGGIISGYDVSIRKYINILNLFRQYDILHFHTFNLFVAVCALMSRKRIIYTEHGVFGFGRKKQWSNYIGYLFIKLFLNFAVDYISFNSKFTMRIAQERYGVKRVNKSVVYNGISFSQERIQLKEVDGEIRKKIGGKFVVGTSSRFAGFKRIDRLILAFSKFQEGKETILLLVGDGVLRMELEKLSKDLGIMGRTLFTGFKENVRAYQELMDVCVFPSENEPFGLVAVEALSLGKPTIVFEDGGGIVEIVIGISKDDVVQDVNNLVKRLDYYHKTRDGINSTAEERRKYIQTFDIRNMNSRFVSIYMDLAIRQ
jgi:glycosyltransferase involved in cell wall biosynthesis